MSDLVQRLRQVGAHHWYEHDGSGFCYQCRTFAADWKNRPSTPCQPDALMTEAADEIERQNRMLETYRAECEGWQAALEKAERQRDEARAVAAQLRQDVEALAAADVELRRKIADLRHIAKVNGDWTVKVSELVAALNTASALLVEAQAERDGAMDTITTRTWERDESRALLLDIDQWFRQDGASFPDYIQGRLDAALGGQP